MNKPKLIRITTVPLSLDKLLSGQLHYMNSFYDVVAISSGKDYLERVGKRENVRTFHLEMSRKITPIHDLIAVLKLFWFLRNEKPHIVHTHTPKAGIVGMLAAKLAGVPHRLHTVAGLPLLETSGMKRTVLDFVERLTYACATKVYPNSFGLATIILQNNYCKATKLKVLANGSSNGIATSFFNPELFSDSQNQLLRKQLGIHPTDFVFIFVGRLVGDKGINEMVAAFTSLHRKHPHAKLLLVGDYEPELDPLLTETMTVIGNDASIISVGFQSEVCPYFSISNCLVFPSYREGFPNVVLQAGAMGLPSIVSAINGCNEIIIEGVNGTIVPVKNVPILLQKMVLLLDDSVYYEHLKGNSRTMITSRYDQHVVWQALLEAYVTL